MSSASASPPGFSIIELSGPQIIADVLHWGLFGTLAVQLYLYYLAFPHERMLTKSMVYIVYALELTQTVLITYDAFITFGYGFGDISALTKIRFGWLTVSVMGGLVALIGQTFYAYRLFMFSKSRLLVVLILSCVGEVTRLLQVSLTGVIGAFLNGAFTFQVRNNVELVTSRKLFIPAGLWLGGSGLTDIMITVFMTYYLTKNSTEFRHTRVLVSKLTRLTIETGAVTALATLITLALLFGFPEKTYYIVPAFLIPKLYANTILAVLNSRVKIMGARGTEMSSGELISMPTHFRSTDSAINHSQQSPSVTIAREVFSDRELDDLVGMKGMGFSFRPGMSGFLSWLSNNWMFIYFIFCVFMLHDTSQTGNGSVSSSMPVESARR